MIDTSAYADQRSAAPAICRTKGRTISMRIRRTTAHAVLALTAAGVLLTGCSPASTAEQPDTTDTSTVDATAPVTEHRPGEVAVTGDILRPTSLTLESLRSYPIRTQSVSFDSSRGAQNHTYDGAALFDIVSAAEPAVDPDTHNPLLAFAIVANASDGYIGTLSWGEISPDFAGTPVLVAYTEDGTPLEQPRLVVPGDVKGGRYVSDLTELRIIDLAPE